jgi:transcriptional regulator with XRE-family HTH domain
MQRITAGRGIAMPRCTEQLRVLRLKAGFSQNRLAREAELDRATVSNAERGKEIQELSLAKILQVLGRKLGREIELHEVVVT